MLKIRPIAPGDVDAVLAIQAASPEAATWSREAYEAIPSSPSMRCLVAETEDKQEVAAFACFRIIDYEAELLNVAVLPAARRRGIATRLLGEVILAATHSGAMDLFLEVWDCNSAARCLYDCLGFQRAGSRPGFYTNPPADALILRLRLSHLARDSQPASSQARPQ